MESMTGEGEKPLYAYQLEKEREHTFDKASFRTKCLMRIKPNGYPQFK